MSEDRTPSIVAADRLNDAVIIEFDNGRCGVFDAKALYTLLPSVPELTEQTTEEAWREDAEQ